MIEPDKEGLAIVRNIRGGISTPSEVLRERGFVPDEFWDEYQEDFNDLDRRGLVIDADARKMTQAGQAQLVAGNKAQPPKSSGNGDGDGAPVEPGDYLSISSAAERFGLHPATLRQWVRKGALAHVRVGPDPGLIRVRSADVARAASPSS